MKIRDTFLIIIFLFFLSVNATAVDFGIKTQLETVDPVIYGKISLETADVMIAPGGEICTKILYGSTVAITGVSDDGLYYEIDMNGKKYVSKISVQFCSTLPDTEKKMDEAPKLVNRIGYVIKQPTARFRREPWGLVLSDVACKTQVRVTEICGSWYKVLYNSKTGYMTKDCILFEQATPGGKPGDSTLPPAANPYNMCLLTDAVGKGKANNTEDVKKVQQRLADLGLLNTSLIDGNWGPESEVAVKQFQFRYEVQIGQIRKDSRRTDIISEKGAKRGTQGKVARNGIVGLNDATFQAMIQALPKRYAGQLVGEAQLYEILKNKILGKGLPFLDDKINLLGARGFQGGQPHNNENARQKKNRYNDTFFLLYLSDGKPKVMDYKVSVDGGPGSSSQHAELQSNQQIEYMYSGQPTRFGNRPAFWMKEKGRILRKNGKISTGNGIAIHTGGSGEYVGGNSAGCQVPHGSWMGHFVSDVERAFKKSDRRRVKYTLLDGKDLL